MKKAGKKSKKAQKPKQKTKAKPRKPVNPAEIEKVITHIISEVAEVDAKKIKPDINFQEDLNIDSMMALEILTAIEKTYKIEIPEESLPKMVNLRAVMKLVKKLLP